MQSSNNENISPKLTYDPSWTGPLNVKRSTTDLYILAPFILVLVNWVRVAIYAFENRDLVQDFNIFFGTRLALRLEKWNIVWALLLTVLLSLIFLFFLIIATKLTSYVFNSVLLLIVFLATCYYTYLLSIDKKSWILATVVIMLIIMMLWALLVFFINRQFIAKASEIIRETTKALMFFPLLFLCSLMLYVLTFATIVFGGVISKYLYWFPKKFQSPFDYFWNQFSNCLGCVWLTLFFFVFFRVVISGTYGTWYWARDKQEVPKFTPMRFIWITLRYHLGSVMTGSLLTPIGRVMQFQGLNHSNFADPTNGAYTDNYQCIEFFRKRFQRCYNRIGMINDQAYLYTALRGQGYCESAKTAFNIWRRNHTKFIAIDQFIRELIFVGFATTSIFSALLYTGLKHRIYCSCQDMTIVLLVFLSINLLIKSIFLPIEVSMDTVLICGLEDFEVNGNSNRPYYMSDKLKEMILENRSSQLDSLSHSTEAIGIAIARLSSEDEQNDQPSNSIEK